MLTLTRRPHEEIVVIDTQTGERIVVAAIGIRGNEMKIGIIHPNRSLRKTYKRSPIGQRTIASLFD